jgi:hypothetical protein
VNAFGQSIELSLRGAHPALQTTPDEVNQFTLQEGAFWGNIFTNTPQRSGCFGTNSDIPQITRRTCASPGGYCPIDIAGSCATQCTQDAGGNYASCGGNSRVVSVYLKPSPTSTCGNSVCETGETQGSCAVDCSPSTVRQGISSGSDTWVVASEAERGQADGVVTLGITTAPVLDVGLPYTLNAISPRDMFIIKQNGSTVQWARRFEIPTKEIGVMDPTSLAVYVDPYNWSNVNIVVAGRGFMSLHGGASGTQYWRIETQMKHDGVWLSNTDEIVTAGTFGQLVLNESGPGMKWVSAFDAIHKHSLWTGAQTAAIVAPITPKAPKWLYGTTLYQAAEKDSSAIKVAAFSTVDGTMTSSATIPVANVVSPKPRAIRADGAIYLAGSGGNGASGTSGFFMKLNNAFAVEWSKQFLTQSDKQFVINSLSIGPSGTEDVAIGGYFSGTQNFAPGGSILRGFGNNLDAFSAKYRTWFGSFKRIYVHGGPGGDTLGAMTFDRMGNLWAFGEFEGKALMAGTYRTSSDGYNGSDLFTVKTPYQSSACEPPPW